MFSFMGGGIVKLLVCLWGVDVFMLLVMSCVFMFLVVDEFDVDEDGVIFGLLFDFDDVEEVVGVFFFEMDGVVSEVW